MAGENQKTEGVATMKNANAAMTAVKEYMEGRKLRRRLADLSSENIGRRFGMGRDKAKAIGDGYYNPNVALDVQVEIGKLFREADRIRPLVRQKSMNQLAAKYGLSKVTIRRYAGLE